MIKIKDIDSLIAGYTVLENSHPADFMPKMLGMKANGVYYKTPVCSTSGKYKTTPPWINRKIIRIITYSNKIYLIVKEKNN